LEFALVIGVAFGWPILGSITALMYGKTVGEIGAREMFGNTHLYGVVLSELICLPMLAAILHARGWRLSDFPLGLSKAATVLGIGAALVAWLANIALEEAMLVLFPSFAPVIGILNAYQPTDAPSLVAIYALSIINPVFEELIVCGYVIPALRDRFGTTVAINVSVLIRVAYHLYQGVVALPFHLAYGLGQAYLFVRFGRLWPLIVSHALLDFAALAYFV
jgi:membrane protease YdiL (CAAX protease family)